MHAIFNLRTTGAVSCPATKDEDSNVVANFANPQGSSAAKSTTGNEPFKVPWCDRPRLRIMYLATVAGLTSMPSLSHPGLLQAPRDRALPVCGELLISAEFSNSP